MSLTRLDSSGVQVTFIDCYLLTASGQVVSRVKVIGSRYLQTVFREFQNLFKFYDMRHKWDNKITKNKQFATCLRCNLVKESIYPYGIVYFVDSSNDFLTKAPPCKNLNSET